MTSVLLHGFRRSFAALLLVLLPAFALPAHAEDDASTVPVEVGEEPIAALGPLRYRPGRGLRVGSTGLVIGGFTNIKAEHTDESGGEFAVDKLNFFFIFDRFTRFRAVADLQLKDIFEADDEHAGTKEFAFDVRRLFGDVTIYDELHVRAGTFLTPVSYWNLILAPPLTWTTESPLIVEETFFEETTTGVMLHGSTGAGPGQLGYSIFTQFLHPLEDDPELQPPDHTAGAQVTYDVLPEWSVGASYQAADTKDEWSHLGGTHLRWQPQRGEILIEALFQDGEDQDAEDQDGEEGEDGEDGEEGGDGKRVDSFQWGTYVQGVFEVYRPFYLVGRYEHFDPPQGKTVNVFTFGGVWKPYPFMALKAEYRVSDQRFDDEDLDGFFASFTTLF